MKKRSYSLIVALFLFLNAPVSMAIQLQNPVPVKLAGGMKFTEGPAWNPSGYLVFSDIDGNVIYRWSEKEGLDTLTFPAGNSNGILYAKPHPFLVCLQGSRTVSTLDERGVTIPIVSNFRGKKFNSPNDLEQSKAGNIYFTDPDFGFNAKSRELAFQGFYLIPAGKHEAVLLDSTLNWPNGLTFSTDGKSLFLCESKSNNIYRYELRKDGLVQNKSLFVKVAGNGLIDGIVTDEEGNLFVAFNRGGIKIFNVNAVEIGHIDFPAGEEVRNLCFGGKNGITLFVTAGKSLYKVE